MTAPIAKTPTIAPGANEATAAKATIIADNKPTPMIPFSKVSVSIPDNASAIPAKNAINTSTAAFIKEGRLFAIPSRTAIRNSNIESIICGVY